MTSVKTKERPILFSSPMIRAILEGRKTQTRRVFRVPRGMRWYGGLGELEGEPGGDLCDDPGEGWYHISELECPFGKLGDRLWCKETFGRCPEAPGGIVYRADWTLEDEQSEIRDWRWMSSLFMPKQASRITLEITEVRVERVQSISEEDAIAEGATRREIQRGAYRGNGWSMDWSRVGTLSRWASGRTHDGPSKMPLTEYDVSLQTARTAFGNLWDTINGKRPGCSWADNPFCWAISFRRID